MLRACDRKRIWPISYAGKVSQTLWRSARRTGFRVYRAHHKEAAITLIAFGKTIGIGSVLGLASGYLLGLSIRKTDTAHLLNTAVLTVILGVLQRLIMLRSSLAFGRYHLWYGTG